MRSSEVPSSVDKLRPGDIDIVGAIGDSLTAGNGAMATNLLEVIVESKGLSWCVGGQGTWRKFLTLPNVLKEFNPDLYGFPERDSVATEKSSRFNIAETGAMSQDIPNMAKNLVKRMLSDPKADVENHWKLITIMIGSNDFCSNICYLDPPEKALEYHEQNLLEVLRLFRDRLPRTLVNLVATPNVNILTQLKGKPRRCEVLHLLECPCFLGARFAGQRQRFVQIIERWNALQANIANREEFHTKSDFGVVWQPCLANISFPSNQNGDSDFSYMSYDCFHLSQKGYARAANALWNNMMEPVGQKAHDWVDEFAVFKCPTPEMPFIRTRALVPLHTTILPLRMALMPENLMGGFFDDPSA
ncbi:hypothetical protein pipiens_014804 [Culex pipiens pipiens]|uniref:Phospholipase B1, membrane-associated n=1 Tax=Culex pipiens pipiens TaxID=38569 RepID=A0ABD1CT10_CULPP